MKLAIMFVLLFGLLSGQYTRAEGTQVQRPHWVIVATVFDRTTGQQINRSRLEGPELEFNDSASCQHILAKVAPVQTDHLRMVLTCSEIGAERVASQ